MKPLFLLLLLLILAGCQSDSAGPVGYQDQDELISERVGSISRTQLMAYVTDFSSIHSRFMEYDEGCTQALNMLVGWIEDQGNVAQWDSFSILRRRWIDTANIFVDFPGTVAPERQVLVGAHWDCSSGNASANDSSAISPGAVDNATGVAALLELMRILKETPTAYTVRVVFFAAEEVGFKGSKRYVEFWDNETGPDSLVCMVNVDMIGWDGDGEKDLRLICHGETVAMGVDALPLAAELAEPVILDTLNWVNPYNAPASDQYWFWLEGLPAMFLWEGPDDAFPHANSTQDTLGAVMPEMLESGAKALAATVLQLAIPQLPDS